MKMFYKFYSGDGIDGEMTIFALNKLPIPKIPKPAQQPFIDLVKKIFTAKKVNPQADTTALEAKIDQLVYELYGLTEEEIAIVEDSVN